jgi:hypothetical protein
MSSALGVTVTPEGETGTVTALKHMPDQLSDNPGTIVANTSIETLQNILNENWIWRNSFTIDPTMRAGQIFGTIKIHPKNCNDYITHISEMFLTWTGSMKIRTRFMATFQFGGSIRLGYLPPKFSASQINSLPISLLTAYPNIDLDPKNTNWVHFQASDERNILFHWMSTLDDETPESFAGWFVFYVASPLVLSGGVSTQISLLVEAAGSFNFSQLSPIANFTPTTGAWLSPSASYDILQAMGCDDYTVNKKYMQLSIQPIAIKNLLVGFATARGIGGAYSTDLAPGSSVIGGVLFHRTTISQGLDIAVTGIGSWDLDTAGAQPHPMRFMRMVTGSGTGLTAHFPSNGERDGMAMTAACPVPAVSTTWPTFSESKHYTAARGIYGRTVPWSGALDPGVNRPYATTYLGWVSPSGTYPDNVPVDPAICNFATDNSLFVNPLQSESIVVFTNTMTRTVNMQTQAMSRDFLINKSSDPTMSQLYNLRMDGTVGPIAQIRLQPSGVMTTNAVSSLTLIKDSAATGPLWLEFIQSLPMSSPLPSVNTFSRKNLALFTRATRKGLSGEQFKEQTVYLM